MQGYVFVIQKPRFAPAVVVGDVFFSGAAMYSGVYGGAMNIGYNLGKEYGPIGMYLRYQRDKWMYKSVILNQRR